MKKLIALLMIVTITSMTLIGCGEEEEINVPVEDIINDIIDELVKDLVDLGIEVEEGVLPGYEKVELPVSSENDEEEDLEEDVLDDLEVEMPGIEMPGMDGSFMNLDMFSEDIIEEGIALAPMISIEANYYIVVKAKEGEDSNVKAALEEKKELEAANFEDYLPEEYEKVQNTVIKQTGNYFIYITDDEPDKFEKIFDEALTVE